MDNELMWVKQWHETSMNGSGLFIPPITMVMTGGWFVTLFYTDTHTYIYTRKYLYMICQLFVYMFLICIMYMAPEEYSASMVSGSSGHGRLSPSTGPECRWMV
jgi:hypothetical protein